MGTPPAGLETPVSAPSAALDHVVEQLKDIHAQIAEFHQRSTHREAVIDRLHDENRQLRAGVYRAILEPVVVDLIRLHDALTSAAAHVESSAMLDSFVIDVEMILDRCGVERFVADVGDPYQPGDHKPLAVVLTDDPERDKTVAEVAAVGFRDRETGRVRRPVHARFFQLREPRQPDQPDEPMTATTDSPDDGAPAMA